MRRLSVIVPVLDEATTIARTLVAVQALRTCGHELIVVDGGSHDDTMLRARPLADRVVKGPRGRALQMNCGAQLATGNVLLFLHADSILPAGAADHVAGALDRGARWGRFDVRIDGRARILKLVARLMNVRSRLTGIATGDQGIFVERDMFDRAGGYPAIALMEDVALSKLLKRCAGRPACLTARIVTSGRRWDTRGPWRTIITMWRIRLAFALGADPAHLARLYR